MRLMLPLIIGCIATGVVAGSEDTNLSTQHDTNKTVVAEWTTQCKANYNGNPDVMLRPGLIANRKTRQVEFFAEATGIRPDEILEFFLIGEKSGNDYEALAIALTEPIHIYDAMVFIGMTPGRGVDSAKLQFWPKGERIHMTIDSHRAESLIIDSETGAPLVSDGFIFIGSKFISSEPPEDATTLAAQTRSPYAIAANYNEAEALFDVPYSAPQTAVYSKQMLNPEYQFQKGARLSVMIEPEYKNGKQRVQELELVVERGTNAAPALINAKLTLKTSGDSNSTTVYALPTLLAQLSAIVDAGHDPFVTLRFGDEVTIGQLHDLAQLLGAIDSEKGIRIEPPVPGQLYYKAFTPNEDYRDREARFLQPWELRLTPSPSGSVTGTVTEITEIWTQGEAKPKIETEDHAVTDPNSVYQLLTSRKPDVKVVLVYAPAILTHSQLMTYLEPARKTHPFVHVYVDP